MSSRVETSAPCDLLAWDTEFFGCRIGRVKGNTLDGPLASGIDRWRRDERIEGLYFLARADCPRTIQIAESEGFNLVDIRMTLERNMQEFRKVRDPNEATIREAMPEDLPALEAIAQSVHTETRFTSDPHFSRSKAEALYSTWIRGECLGRAQRVLVAASAENRPLGYISCHSNSNSKEGKIGLLGICQDAQGKGLGKALVSAALNWFSTEGASEVTVVTQGKNIAAQRLYQRCGFITRDVQLWYHKWYLNAVVSNV